MTIRNKTDIVEGESPKNSINLYKSSLNPPPALEDLSMLPMLSKSGNNINIPNPSKIEAMVVNIIMIYILDPKWCWNILIYLTKSIIGPNNLFIS